MRKTVIALVVCVSVYLGISAFRDRGPSVPTAPTYDRSEIAAAVQSQASGVQVQGEGILIKELPDDLQGSRHQRILLRIASGGTLLIAHNIDLAPRVTGLREGDRVEFYGQFEWNEKGGVVHWTHHDPQGRHIAGWLKHNGQTYQ